MSHCVNTQALHLWDQIWCRAQVKWVWWPQARLLPIAILKQNHKSFAGSRDQRPEAETAGVVQVGGSVGLGELLVTSGSPVWFQLMRPTDSFSSISTNIHADFTTSLSLPNPRWIFPKTFHETSPYLSLHCSDSPDKSNVIVTYEK